MARRYLLVEVTKDRILIVDKVKAKDRQKVIREKKDNQEVLSVKSYEDGYRIISAHNQAINPQKKIVDREAKKEIKLWNWKKVDEETKAKIMSYFEVQDWFSIFEIHNSLELTDENYCCSGYIQKVKYNIRQAKKKGIINESISKDI